MLNIVDFLSMSNTLEWTKVNGIEGRRIKARIGLTYNYHF